MALEVPFDPTSLRSLYNSATLSDVTVCFGDRRIRAHKVILAMQSPYFKTAFAGNFKEAKTDEIWLYEDDPEAVTAMLMHIYGLEYLNPVNHSDTSLKLKIFATADKYDVPTLLCLVVDNLREAIWNSVSWDNHPFVPLVREVYENLPAHNGELKEIVLEICKRDLKRLYQGPEFRQLLTEVSELAVDVVRVMAEDEDDEPYNEEEEVMDEEVMDENWYGDD